jgi:Protein of unknown function (DUF2946)
MQGTLRALRHLAIVALFVRALLPAGWMPDAQAGMVICSATLGMVHHDTAPGHSDQHQTQGEECPFAASSVMAAAPDAPHIALPATHAFIARIDQAHAAIIAARFTPGAPRAPPLNA